MIDLNKYIPTDFSGAIYIIEKNKTIFKRSYGFRDYPNRIENKLDTIFGTASAGKAFIATAILKLVEDKKIKLDDNILKYLPNEFKDIYNDIKVLELLNHTSGIGDYFDEDKMEDYSELWEDYPNYKIRKNDDLIPLFINKDMKSNPGEKFEYNNTGYVILAKIMENITGMLFDEYLKKAIFQPIGMKNTGYYEMDRLPSNTAIGYIYDNENKEYYSNIYSIDVKGTGAGGCYTTVEDIYRFWKALENNIILDKEFKEIMFSNQVLDDGFKYGYGFWIGENKLGLHPYIQGMDPGVRFISSYIPQKDIVTIIVSNFEDNVWEINREILNEII